MEGVLVEGFTRQRKINTVVKPIYNPHYILFLLSNYTHDYFNGGNEDGSGYKFVGYQNFPTQLVVLDKILQRNPESLLDIGGARGYISKMFEQTTGKPGWCLDISEYCHATRVTDKFILGNLSDKDFWCTDLLPIEEKKIDLVFSIAMFEHLKEEDIPLVIKRISNIGKRGLICPSFYDVDDPDHTHETLKPKEWWEKQFETYAPGWPVEIVDKEEMEKGDLKFQLPRRFEIVKSLWTMSGRFVDEDVETMKGNNDRKIVMNIGSYIVMFRSTPEVCVINTDILDLHEFSLNWGYNFVQYTAPGLIPVKSESVDEINCSHMFEHLTREEADVFLFECFRVLKKGGSIRITVPDLHLLAKEYVKKSVFDKEIKMHGIYNKDVEKAEDEAHALFHMITSGGEHKTAYDHSALNNKLLKAGFNMIHKCNFNEKGYDNSVLIEKVGWDMYPESSLYVVGRK